jgi:ribose 5-phosphate isomerase B
MQIFLGADHGGVQAKEAIIHYLQANYPDWECVDCGSDSLEPSDYPDFAAIVCRNLISTFQNKENKENAYGILLCRSGEGMVMAANKFPGIRAALVWQDKIAIETRQDNDANVIVFPSDYMAEEDMFSTLNTFFATSFSEEPRHTRRLEKLKQLEEAEYES